MDAPWLRIGLILRQVRTSASLVRTIWAHRRPGVLNPLELASSVIVTSGAMSLTVAVGTCRAPYTTGAWILSLIHI